MRNYNWMGKIAFYLGWPAIAIYLAGSQRSRIVVFSENYILVLKAWLGDGKWTLPGGGINPSEPIIDGVLRELREETGLQLEKNNLKELSSENFKLRAIRVKLHFFSAEVATRLLVHKQPGEITAIEWVHQAELNASNTDKDALRGIAIWKS